MIGLMVLDFGVVMYSEVGSVCFILCEWVLKDIVCCD